MFGFMGRILVVDLTSRSFEVLTRDVTYYKKYLGGSYLAAKLFDEQIGDNREIAPFSAENPIVFATGVLAGGPVCGPTRVNILSLSPETTGIFVSQAGGEFGPDMKRAGYDALVIKGAATAPVYLIIDNDSVRFKDATSYWGMDRLDLYHLLKDKLEKKHTVATIGLAGENRMCNANIMFEPDHYAGRGGLGAVLGAKNLKALCIRGDQKPEFAVKKNVQEMNKAGSHSFKKEFEATPNGFLGVLKNYGTFGLLQVNQDVGNLPVRNFSETWLEDKNVSEQISHSASDENFVGKKVPCKGCYVACKKSSKFDDTHTALAEYESMALLGPNLGINDPKNAIEACELCNHLGVDTMSMGNMIGYIMDCFEHGLLDPDQYGPPLKFGDITGTLELIENIAKAKGPLGSLLAQGIEKTSQALGDETRQFMRFSKGVGIPAHLPRVKPGIGFGYLHGPNPGDHMKLEHDWISSAPGLLKGFGLDITSKIFDLDKNKVEIARATQIYYSTMDCISMCMFIFGPGNTLKFEEIVELVNGAAGFDYSFQDLMKIGENAIQLQKKLYMDFGGSDEKLLPYMEEAIPSGPMKGKKIDRADFDEARSHYYKLWNWDEEGRPRQNINAFE